MRVADTCSDKIVTVRLDDTLKTVRALFSSHGFHHLLVIEGRRLVGVISDRDLLRDLSPHLGSFGEQSRDRACLQRKVHQIMTRELVTIGPDTELADAASIMLNHGVSCLPIVDEAGRPVGIVSWRDLLAWTAQARCRLDLDEAA